MEDEQHADDIDDDDHCTLCSHGVVVGRICLTDSSYVRLVL